MTIVLNKRATQSLKLQKAWEQGGDLFAPPQFKTMDARDLKWSLWHQNVTNVVNQFKECSKRFLTKMTCCI